MRDLWISVREGAIAAIAAGTSGRVDEIILYAVLDHMTVDERIELRVGKKFSWDLEKPHPAKHLFWVHNVIHTAGNHSAVDVPPVLDSLADATRLIRIITVMTKHERTWLAA
jgi:hypothetical protein